MARVSRIKGVVLRVRELPSGNQQQYLDVHRDGERWTETVPFGLLTGDRIQDKEARIRGEEYFKKRVAEFDNGHGVSAVKKNKESFIQYCEDLADKRLSENTKISWRNAIAHLKKFRNGDTLTFAQLNRELFEDYREYLLKEAKPRLSPNSAQIYLARVKTALHQAVDEARLPRDPSAKVTIKKKDKLPVHLTLEEVQKLSETPCANEQVKAAFLFSCFTGLRYSDVDALTWDKIWDGHIEFSQRKTDAAERLPLSAEALRILKMQKNAVPSPNIRRVFPDNSVFFMPTQPVVDKQLKKWAKVAGISKVISFHKSRHTFATLSLTSGVDLYTTSKLLGHRNLQTTQIYAKVVDEKKRQAVLMLPTLRK